MLRRAGTVWMFGGWKIPVIHEDVKRRWMMGSDDKQDLQYLWAVMGDKTGGNEDPDQWQKGQRLLWWLAYKEDEQPGIGPSTTPTSPYLQHYASRE